MCLIEILLTDCQGLISPYADLEIVSSITGRSHTFIKIDHELFSMINLPRYFKEGCC